MGMSSDEALKSPCDVTDVADRQFRTDAHVKVGNNFVGVENASQQSRGKGIQFQKDSRWHMSGKAQNYQYGSGDSLMSSSQNSDARGEISYRLPGEAVESQVVPNSRSELNNSFLRLLQAGDSPGDQRRQVLGVLKSNPKLLRDYMKSRGIYVEQPDLNFDSAVKKSTESWGEEGAGVVNNFKTDQGEDWSQHQQLIGDQVQCFSDNLAKQEQRGLPYKS